MQLVKTAETFWLKHETLGGICGRVRGDKLHRLERYLMGIERYNSLSFKFCSVV